LHVDLDKNSHENDDDAAGGSEEELGSLMNKAWKMI
jgi:hypothetical protein